MKKKSELFGLSLEPWVSQATTSKGSGKVAVAVISAGKSFKIPGKYAADLKSWQRDLASKKQLSFMGFETDGGVLFFVAPLLGNLELESDSALKTSAIARYRDALGHLLQTAEKSDIQSLEIDFETSNKQEIAAGILGLELASYKYKRARKAEGLKISLNLKCKGRTLPSNQIHQAGLLGLATNVARHLTNLPANELNPETYASAVESLFSGTAVKVDVWDLARIKKEKMNLLMAVGQGSATPPCMVHLKYRPKGLAKSAKPIAIVGKGITFDTGGVDIKPSSSMRLMKKDMGGSAAVVGLMLWAVWTGEKKSLDSYIALAENSVGSRSFRPGDIITARSGQTVEIHNTDAEGRLVLADAMDVAVTRSGADAPMTIIDVATLTGAIKGALGTGMAGLFANDAKLSKSLHSASQDCGELVWPMPLFQKYRSQLNSHFADVVNATDGFGGAITAALFLETYAKKVPWAHLDIYAWKDSPEGAWSEAGGSGQGVQLLAQFLG